MSHYTVTAEWTGRWWVLQAVEAPGAISQVRRLSEAGQIIEAIAFVTGNAESSIEFDLQPEIPSAAADQMAAAEEARELSRHYNTVSAIKARSAVLALRSRGLTLDDIGTLLHISKQRVSQLLKDGTAASAA